MTDAVSPYTLVVQPKLYFVSETGQLGLVPDMQAVTNLMQAQQEIVTRQIEGFQADFQHQQDFLYDVLILVSVVFGVVAWMWSNGIRDSIDKKATEAAEKKAIEAAEKKAAEVAESKAAAVAEEKAKEISEKKAVEVAGEEARKVAERVLEMSLNTARDTAVVVVKEEIRKEVVRYIRRMNRNGKEKPNGKGKSPASSSDARGDNVPEAVGPIAAPELSPTGVRKPADEKF